MAEKQNKNDKGEEPSKEHSKNKEKEREPTTAPQPGRWYNLALGPSFKEDHSSSKFCSLNYESRPESVDKDQPGSLHKSRDNKVNVAFQNKQHGKPQVTFEGVNADHDDNEAVLIYDGENFRLERLHRAVKQLRQVLESPSIMPSSVEAEPQTSPDHKEAQMQSPNKGSARHMSVEPSGIGSSRSEGAQSKSTEKAENVPTLSDPPTASPDTEDHKSKEHADTVNDNEYDDPCRTAEAKNSSTKEIQTGIAVHINMPPQVDTDDKITDVDANDGESGARAQVNDEVSSSSSCSRGSKSETADVDAREKQTSNSGHRRGRRRGRGSGVRPIR